jgi:hypothetical protein
MLVWCKMPTVSAAAARPPPPPPSAAAAATAEPFATHNAVKEIPTVHTSYDCDWDRQF